jgi:AcrR family transcriptional regulator
MERDRKRTEQRILNAVGRMLARTGFRHIGINTVAKEAGVDKVLIYRYFGGMSGLLAAFARQTPYWPRVEELAEGFEDAGETSQAAVAGHMLHRFIGLLRERSLTQEMLRWELMEKNELTDTLTDFREREGLRLMQQFEPEKDVDLPSLVALLSAGIIYLILRQKNTERYNGVDLQSEEGWRRIERTAAWALQNAISGKDEEKKR